MRPWIQFPQFSHTGMHPGHSIPPVWTNPCWIPAVAGSVLTGEKVDILSDG